MITPELLNYVNSQKKQGVDRNTVGNLLKNNNWTESDIDSVLSQVYDGIVCNSTTETSLPRKSTKNISILLAILSLLSIISTWLSIRTFLIINRYSLSSGKFPFEYFKYFPLVNLPSLIASLSAIIFMYLGLRVRRADSKSYRLTWLFLISLYVVGIVLGFIVNSQIKGGYNFNASN